MAEERVQRRLAAILIANVVAYSRLMEADEEDTRARLRSLHADVIEPYVTADGGRVVKTSGDGMLVEFPSAVDAVRNAVRTQAEIHRRNDDVPEDRRIVYRVGINVGDIIVEGDDIFGDGVNVASRLEGLCAPGGVYISGNVYAHVNGKLPVDFEDLGEQTVKNISSPVRMFRVFAAGAEPVSAAPSDAVPTPADKPSIAVLPFDNMSGDPDQAYFSDGLAEDLITDLSKMSGLFVVARNTAFSFRGQMGDVGRIGRQLGVAHVLEGSVRKAGNRVRINTQLIETATGGHVWAERYDGSLDDIFAVQDEITAKIVAELRVRLTAREAAAGRRRITDNVEAYELYLNARAEHVKMDPKGTSEGVRLLKAAIAIDPGFAAAYATLSGALQHGWTFLFPGFEDALERSLEMARRGVEADGSMGLTHARLGWALTFVRRHDEGIAGFERAVELEPKAPETYLWFAEALNYAGDPARGLKMARRFIELDPAMGPLHPLVEGHSHYLMRNYQAAIDCFKYSISLAEGFQLPYLLLGIVYSELGREDEAAAAITLMRESLPPNMLEAVVQRLPYRDEEPKRRMAEAVARAAASNSTTV
ncbi:MAG: adenylate/guanylate cyclase domain-containing protein [Alphaproteobacteria bacterium]